MALAGILGAVVAPSIIKRVPSGRVSIGTAVVAAVALLPVAFTNDVVTIAAFLVLLSTLGGQTAMLLGGGMVCVSVLPLVLSRHVRTLPTPDRWPIAI